MSKAKSGSYEGSFLVRRPLSGRQVWKRGDTRDDKIVDVAHLIATGALAPKDAATAKAASEFLGVDVKVGEPVDRDAATSLSRPLTLSTGAAGAPIEGQGDGNPGSGTASDGQPGNTLPPATMSQTRTQLEALAKQEGVTVETDDNKADLVRKIADKRAASGEAIRLKAESERSVLNKAEASDAANKTS